MGKINKRAIPASCWIFVGSPSIRVMKGMSPEMSGSRMTPGCRGAPMADAPLGRAVSPGRGARPPRARHCFTIGRPPERYLIHTRLAGNALARMGMHSVLGTFTYRTYMSGLWPASQAATRYLHCSIPLRPATGEPHYGYFSLFNKFILWYL